MIPTRHQHTALLAALLGVSCAHSSQNQKADDAGDEVTEEPIGVTNEESIDEEDDQAEPEEPGEGEQSIEEQLALQAVRQSLEGDEIAAGQEGSNEDADSGAQASEPTDDNGPLKLRIIQQGPDQPWVMGVVNDGSDEVELVADPRLMRFDVKVPGKNKTVTCQLPGELFPKRSHPSYLVLLGPGQGVVKAFDPRLYCFASTGQHVLVPGAIVTPSFGWPEKTKTVWKRGKPEKVKLPQQPPFVAKLSTASNPEPGTQENPTEEAAGIKTLTSHSFSLGSDYKKWSAVGLAPPEQDPSPIGIEMRQGSDAHSQLGATVAITLKNRDKTTRYVYFRRELLSFEVMGPGGLTNCDPQPDTRAPDRQAFLRLRPGQTMTITSRLVELCPKGTFSHPGFYLVHARFDAPHDGEEFDLDAYVGRVSTQKPANVRIRTGELDLYEKQAMRPLQVREVSE